MSTNNGADTMKWLLRREFWEHKGSMFWAPLIVGALLVVLLGCAIVTERVGIHAVFGAFVAGAVMPRGRFSAEVAHSVERLTAVILLPIFFVYSGLNTQVELLLDPALLGIAALVIGLAFVCKAGACSVATRFSGATWREAAGIGVLMNARGLMELVLINVGRDKGLISPSLFAILVLMTIVTTAAATPLFRLTLRGVNEVKPAHPGERLAVAE
jgi:Kef-type K+ transport system membrane component KefB